eukprot:6070657-Prymnesium_polylepis.1
MFQHPPQSSLWAVGLVAVSSEVCKAVDGVAHHRSLPESARLCEASFLNVRSRVLGHRPCSLRSIGRGVAVGLLRGAYLAAWLQRVSICCLPVTSWRMSRTYLLTQVGAAVRRWRCLLVNPFPTP